MAGEVKADGLLAVRVARSDGETATISQMMQLSVGERLSVILSTLDQTTQTELSSTNPRVRLFFTYLVNRVRTLAEAEAHRTRAVTPRFKERPPDGVIEEACPVCLGVPDLVGSCEACGFTGTISTIDVEPGEWLGADFLDDSSGA